jgi:hypothetical protein
MPDFVSRVEELGVFQRAYRLSLEVHRASLDFPRMRQQQSRPEFRRFVVMAIGSADEMQVWVLYCRDLGYIAEDVAERWRGEYREIARMLSALRASSSDN